VTVQTVTVSVPGLVVTNPGTAAYLTATVGTVTTPDPGPLPAQHCFVFKIRLTAGYGIVAAQFDNWGWYSWKLLHATNAIDLTTTGDGEGAAATSIPVAVPTSTSDRLLAVAVTLDDAGTRRHTSWHHDGSAFAEFATVTGPELGVHDSPDVVRIGAWGGVPGADNFPGRIYSVELRSGLDPNAGTVLWRFDANDWPGSGTSYVDPRGRTWTLTSAAAITPQVSAVVTTRPVATLTVAIP